MKTTLKFLDRWPPFLVYALARKHYRGGSNSHARRLTIKEIAERSGMHRRKIYRLSNRLTWSGIPPERIDAFASACGFNFWDTRAQRWLLKQKIQGGRNQFSWLRPNRWRKFVKMCQKWNELKTSNF